MDEITRREFVGVTAGTLAAGSLLVDLASADQPTATVSGSLIVNGQKHEIECDPRTTLLDLLRDTLRLTGSKKGCDHGQCGACTVLVNGTRVASCLTLAVTQDGSAVTTIEGLASASGDLHPIQTAFIENDAFQCGFCTSGQICSALGMLKEWHAGMPSAVRQAELTDPEIRERMAGNICRCGAYPNIVAAIKEVHNADSAGARL